MARARIDIERTDSRSQIQDWLSTKDTDHSLGLFVGHHIQQEMSKMQMRVRECERLMEHYDDIRSMLALMGFDPRTAGNHWVRSKIEQGLRSVDACDDSFLQEMKNLREHIHRIEMLVQTKKAEAA
jgi:virulence-associated protein VapD